jgi:hypothetical protein
VDPRQESITLFWATSSFDLFAGGVIGADQQIADDPT